MSDSGSRGKSGKQRAFRWGLRGAGGLVALLILSVGVGLLWVRSDSGRSYVCERVQADATEGMGGSMKIGSIDEILFFEGGSGVRVKATDVRFLAPDGRETIHVGDADVLLDLAALVTGTIEIHEAVAANGTVTIEIDDDGLLSIEKTFVGEEESPSADTMGLNLRHMNARDMRVILALGSDASYEVRGIDGTVFVTRPEGGEFVTTELVKVSGELKEPKFLGDPLGFSRLDGRIASNQTPMVKMSVLLSLDEGTIDTRLSVDPDSELKIKLKMSAEGDSEVEFLTKIAEVGSFFGSSVSIETGALDGESK